MRRLRTSRACTSPGVSLHKAATDVTPAARSCCSGDASPSTTATASRDCHAENADHDHGSACSAAAHPRSVNHATLRSPNCARVPMEISRRCTTRSCAHTDMRAEPARCGRARAHLQLKRTDLRLCDRSHVCEGTQSVRGQRGEAGGVALAHVLQRAEGGGARCRIAGKWRRRHGCERGRAAAVTQAHQCAQDTRCAIVRRD